VQSADCYHSVNTGKLGLAPLLALEVADRITADVPAKLWQPSLGELSGAADHG
jgi:hypothetical protein